MVHLKRALRDIRGHRFLNVLTVLTIALAILIVGAFSLFFLNVSDLMNAWQQGVRVMAYLKPGLAASDVDGLQERIAALGGVRQVRFISAEEALQQLREQMKRQRSLLDDLKTNPLPDAFEIRTDPSSRSLQTVEALAGRLEALDAVDEVEYGQKWLGRFSGIVSLFRMSGYALGCLFFAAAVFIVANTTRLVLYSRQQEIGIMRLVGATDGFIKTPFYYQGVLQGAAGGVLGLAALWFLYLFAASRVQQGFAVGAIHVRYLPVSAAAAILFSSMFVGWLGSYLCLRQFLKDV